MKAIIFDIDGDQLRSILTIDDILAKHCKGYELARQQGARVMS